MGRVIGDGGGGPPRRALQPATIVSFQLLLAASRLVLCNYYGLSRYDTKKDTTVDSTHDVFTHVFFSNTK